MFVLLPQFICNKWVAVAHMCTLLLDTQPIPHENNQADKIVLSLY